MSQKYPAIKCIIPGNPFASLFRDIKIRINGLEVSHSCNAYPHVSEFLFLTRIPKLTRDIVEQSGRIFYDYQDTYVNAPLASLPGAAALSSSTRTVTDLLPYSTTSDSGWKDLNDRYDHYSINSDTFVDISTYLFCDLTVGGMNPLVLPPSCTVEIELHPNPPNKVLLLSEIGNIEPNIEIMRAELTLPRITPASSVPRSLTHQFLSIDVQPMIIPAKATNYRGLVTFAGSLPTRLNLVFCSMKAWDGGYGENHYASVPRDVESIAFQVAGIYYPVPPIACKLKSNYVSDMYIRTAEALRHSLHKAKTSLPSLNRYMDNQFIFSVDISPDYSAGASWQTNKESGAISMELKFRTPTSDQFIVLVLSEHVSTLSISNSGVVNLNDS